MAETAVARRADELIRRCYVGLDVSALRVEALQRLRKMISVDAAFFATVDPTTMLFTSALSEEPLIEAAGLFLANEYGPADVNRFVDLAAARDPVSTLDRATRGSRTSSARYTQIMAPLRLGDELRIALRAGGHCWGVICLHRQDGPLGFDGRDVALIRRLAPHLAEGLRRATLLGMPSPDEAAAEPGVLVLDHAMQMVSINAAAESWLSEIADSDWPRSSELPVAVYSAVADLDRLEADGAPVTSANRLKTASGRWVSIHASRMYAPSGVQTAVLLQAASAARLTSLFLAARGLTPAQERVAGLVLRGLDTAQIVDALHISQYTVQEHLKAVFDKFGVRSRRELVASLLGGN